MSDIQKAIEALNTAYAADPAAIHALICNRVPCNEALADHPTVTVNVNPVIAPGKSYNVGALGLLNGALGAVFGQNIAAMFSEEADADGVHRLLGFCAWQPPQADAEAVTSRV